MNRMRSRLALAACVLFLILGCVLLNWAMEQESWSVSARIAIGFAIASVPAVLLPSIRYTIAAFMGGLWADRVVVNFGNLIGLGHWTRNIVGFLMFTPYLYLCAKQWKRRYRQQ